MEQTERYYLEQMFIPNMLYSENCQQFLMVLLQDRGDFFLHVLNEIGKQTGYRCPYEADQFVFKPQIIAGEDNSQDIAFLMIEMPEPERMPLCSRIIICHDAQLSNPRYYTVEKTLGENKFMLCGVDEQGCHLNFGPMPGDEKALFTKIYGFYSSFLSEQAESHANNELSGG